MFFTELKAFNFDVITHYHIFFLNILRKRFEQMNIFIMEFINGNILTGSCYYWNEVA